MNTKIDGFELLDGSILEGYPIACPSIPESNELQLDTTGQYLSLTTNLKRRLRKKRRSVSEVTVFSTKIYLSFLPIPTGFSETAVCSLQWYRCRMVSPIPVRAVFNNRLSESISNGGFIIRIAPSTAKDVQSGSSVVRL